MPDSPIIHPTALIHASAQLAEGVRVGPYAIVEADAVIGTDTIIHAHAQILKGSVIGAKCVLGHACIVGGEPQAKGFDPETPSRVVMGDRNVLREHVTVHRSLYAGGETKLGHGNFLMAGSHLGHDVVMEDDVVMANGVLIAGHVSVGSRCFLGGGSGFHQFIRIGESAMVQGNASLSMDVPPYCVLSGLNTVCGLNSVGLRRQGHTSEARLELKRAFDLIFRSGKNLGQAVEEAQAKAWGPLAANFIQFIANRGKKGVATLSRTAAAAGERL